MRVDRNLRVAKRRHQHHTRGLSAHAGQLHQLLARIGHAAGVLLDQRARRGDDVLRLVVVQAAFANQGLQLFGRELRHRERVRIHRKQPRGHEIDALIRALRGQDGRNQRLERIGEIQLRPRLGIQLRQRIHNLRRPHRIHTLAPKHNDTLYYTHKTQLGSIWRTFFLCKYRDNRPMRTTKKYNSPPPCGLKSVTGKRAQPGLFSEKRLQRFIKRRFLG